MNLLPPFPAELQDALDRAMEKLPEIMMGKDDVPCRVSAELRKHEREQYEAERFPPEFDEWDDGAMTQICGSERVGKAVQSLLLTLREIERAQSSFGADHGRVVAALLSELVALRAACKEEFSEL